MAFSNGMKIALFRLLRFLYSFPRFFKNGFNELAIYQIAEVVFLASEGISMVI